MQTHVLSTLKSGLRGVPGLVTAWNALPWRRRYLHKLAAEKSAIEAREFRKRHLLSRISKQPPYRVLAGPFQGMRYIDTACGSRLLPKLIGSYEEPIHGWIRGICAQKYRLIVDVGCAEGYYAVGFARMMRDTSVIAFDTDARGRSLCAELAGINEADNVEVRAGAMAADLDRIDMQQVDTLVFMDVEGAEIELLDPSRIPGLAFADLIVEIHEHVCPGITGILLRRFWGSHEAELIADYPTRRINYLLPDGSRCSSAYLDEDRESGMLWLKLKKKRCIS